MFFRCFHWLYKYCCPLLSFESLFYVIIFQLAKERIQLTKRRKEYEKEKKKEKKKEKEKEKEKGKGKGNEIITYRTFSTHNETRNEEIKVSNSLATESAQKGKEIEKEIEKEKEKGEEKAKEIITYRTFSTHDDTRKEQMKVSDSLATDAVQKGKEIEKDS